VNTPPEDAATAPEGQTEPTPAETSPAGSEGPGAPETQPEAPPSEGDDELARTGREAASRRVALREVEAERDQLRSEVEGFQRAEAERLASQRLRDGSDLWTAGVELGDLLEDGAVSDERIAAACSRLLEEKPHFARPPVDFGAGVRRPLEQPPSFGQALKRSIGQQPPAA
jgi:hypothetical protein